MEHYKTFKLTVHCIPKSQGEQGSIVHWTIEYEKLHDEIIDPHTLVQFCVDVSKDLEVHLLEDQTPAQDQTPAKEQTPAPEQKTDA